MTLLNFYKQTINERTKETRGLKKEIFKLKQELKILRAEGKLNSELESDFFSKVYKRKALKEDSRYLYLAYATLRKQDLSKVEVLPLDSVALFRLENFMARMESKYTSL